MCSQRLPRVDAGASTLGFENNALGVRIQIAALVFAVSMAFAGMGSAQDALDFRPVAGFLKLPDGMTLGPCSGVDVDRFGNVYVIQRKAPANRANAPSRNCLMLRGLRTFRKNFSY